MTPPDADPSEGGMDMDMTDSDPAAFEAWMKTFREGQVRQAKKNPMLRERLIQLAEEARKEGVI